MSVEARIRKYINENVITDWFDAGVIEICSDGTSPTKISGGLAPTADKMLWRRERNIMHMTCVFEQTAAGGGGTGTYLIQMPGGYDIDSSFLDMNNGALDARTPSLGHIFILGTGGAPRLTGGLIPYDSKQFYASLLNNGDQNAWGSSFGSFAGSLDIGFHAFIPIKGWD